MEFKYDYLGRRVEKLVRKDYNGTIYATVESQVRYLYDGWNLLFEFDALNSLAKLNWYVWGLDLSGTLQGAGGVGGLLQWRGAANDTPEMVIDDGGGNIHGGVTRVAGAQPLGTISSAYEYDAYGDTLRESGVYAATGHIRFSTKYTDIETGLIYHDTRYYSPSLGRFITRDSIGEQGGLNLYAYVSNRVPNAWDYLGFVQSTGSSTYYDDDNVHQLPPLVVTASGGTSGLSSFANFIYTGDMLSVGRTFNHDGGGYLVVRDGGSAGGVQQWGAVQIVATEPGALDPVAIDVDLAAPTAVAVPNTTFDIPNNAGAQVAAVAAQFAPNNAGTDWGRFAYDSTLGPIVRFGNAGGVYLSGTWNAARQGDFILAGLNLLATTGKIGEGLLVTSGFGVGSVTAATPTTITATESAGSRLIGSADSALRRGLSRLGNEGAVFPTNAAARAQAAKLGYNPVRQVPFNSHGQQVFKSGNRYITRDVDSHSGGAWKVFDQLGRRLGTYSEDLATRIGP